MAFRQRGRERSTLVYVFFFLGVAISGSALWGGMEYYVLPIQERPFSPLHALYAPTGLIGQGLGIIGTFMIGAGVCLYMLRKRVPALARIGTLKDWLHVHIFLCLLGPFLVLLHTTFKFGGLVAISFWSMAVVVASGLFGRYVYVWIPKTMNGRFLSAEELRARMRTLLEGFGDELALTHLELEAILHPRPDGARRRSHDDPRPSRRQELVSVGAAGSSESRLGTGSPGIADQASGTDLGNAGGGSGATSSRRRRLRRHRGILGALGETLRYRIGRRSERARFHRELAAAGVPRMIRDQVVAALDEQRRIESQLELLQPLRRAFRYWHAFHLPLASLMFLVLLVHVGVALAFGYTWIF